MHISTRFPVAVHLLLLVRLLGQEHKVTSDFIAKSVGTNPVVIRNIMSQLREAGLIEILAGTGGIKLLREPGEITLLQVYNAVDPVDNSRLFRIHGNPLPQCTVGGNISRLLSGHFSAAQQALEKSLDSVSLQKLITELDDLTTTPGCDIITQ
ncbi:MAG TPA: Rrf2 family transcriptional regulator [Bacillota bacterium]|nr:Rrf2 family transcriptional regulator [Bacillota bacterium]